MAPKKYRHPNRMRGVAEAEVSRLEPPDRSVYSARFQSAYGNSVDKSNSTRGLTMRSAIWLRILVKNKELETDEPESFVP
jgi:hypothetical protein